MSTGNTDGFLPVTRQEMEARGISQPDFVYVCGDAYVDHPSFGSAIISRVLEDRGYSVGMICQPNWRDPKSIDVFGEQVFIGSFNNQDAVLSAFVYKNRCNAARYTLDFLNVFCINASILEIGDGIICENVITNFCHHQYIGTVFCSCNCLIGSFSAAAHGKIRCFQCFAQYRHACDI